jgi:hypothetical protein
MENIYSTNDDFDKFDFSKMELTKPIPVQGGNHFIKFLVKNGNHLYVQPPACISKQGIVKVGKKYYCDLMFTNENEHFIRWIENLETHCHKYIYENRQKWFDNEMELPDIENYFTSPIKLFKSGKYYSIRANIQTILDKPKLKIYNESGEEVEYSAITSTAQLMTIIEVQGIRCSTRSFQIDMEIKQAMVLRQVNLFDTCLFKPHSKPVENDPRASSVTSEKQTVEEQEEIISEEPSRPEIASDLGIFVNTNKPSEPVEDISENVMPDKEAANELEEKEVVSEKPENDNSDELQEIVFHLDELPENDQITLKNRNDVYYEMYREARRKAKYARSLALASYLEAKNIKNKYMLEDIDDSDESEIDSDLENDEEDDLADQSR